MKQMNQWRDVSASLPPMETPVLAIAGGYPNNWLCAALRRKEMVQGEEGWRWAVSNGELNNPSDFDDEGHCDITHWMPLPKLPKRSKA